MHDRPLWILSKKMLSSIGVHMHKYWTSFQTRKEAHIEHDNLILGMYSKTC